MPTRPLTPKHVEAAKEITDRWDEMNRKGSCTKEICITDIAQALSQTEARVKEEVLNHFRKVEKEKWNDAEHCSCLAYAIHQYVHSDAKVTCKGGCAESSAAAVYLKV